MLRLNSIQMLYILSCVYILKIVVSLKSIIYLIYLLRLFIYRKNIVYLYIERKLKRKIENKNPDVSV